MTEKPDAVDLDHVSGDVKFCDISFRYGENSPLVLNGLNLHIKAGETVALVGPSGGGKTTLIKMLLRLYDPLHGEPSGYTIFTSSLKNVVNLWSNVCTLKLFVPFKSVCLFNLFMLTGCILVDNQNIQNVQLESLRRHVGLVSQDIVRF